MHAAILASTLFSASWVADFIALSPLADFTSDWFSISAEGRLRIGIALAFSWTALGYGVGARLGIGLRNRQRPGWFDLLPAVTYVLAMPVIAYSRSEPVSGGPTRWLLIAIRAVLSAVPVLFGYFGTPAAEYLAFRTRLAWLKHRARSLERESFPTA